MNAYPIDHAVIRYCSTHKRTILFYPYRIIEPNRCPVIIIKEGQVERSHLGILVFESTRPANVNELSSNIYYRMAGSKSLRLNSEMEDMFKHGRQPLKEFPKETSNETLLQN